MAALKIGNYYITKNDPRFLLRKVAELTDENKQLKNTLSKVKHEIEEELTFCSVEAEGHINPKKCNIAIRFFKKLLEDLKEVK